LEPKKTHKADLENKRNIFLLTGAVVALGLVFIAFNINGRVKPANTYGNVTLQQVEDEIIPITRAEETKPLPPPPPPMVAEIIPVVDDNSALKEEFELPATEADASTIVDQIPTIEEEKDVETDETNVYSFVDDMPEFPGGERALSKWIADHLIYPTGAVNKGIQGKVYVQFIVERDGSIHEAKVTQSVEVSLDKEALRVINSLPNWKPGMQRGRPVRVSYTVPISFHLK
jgi:protein TonB